ncbi:MATE family efflux transporter [Clostridium sp. NSJ-6]|uniref:Probable multidrug resistance protein NorM n=1 Tax=Clostridium hominis TaxID=2763036 RepID=A0ABR7DE76_9CLOT|nr:MATE family efflux transporter [Clostridium hominis]MBC5629668.1 MATE family efflux transporter [Clostridium hominis]
MISTIKNRFTNSSTMDMTKGKPYKVIIAFAIPLMIGNVFQQLYSMVDTMVVGRFIGTNALAAVGATSPVVQLLIGLIVGLTGGLSVVVAQKFGAGAKKLTRKSIINGLYLTIAISIIITVLGLLLNRALFELINTAEDIIDGALVYSSILFIGAITTAIYNYEVAVLRAFGNSFIPLVFLIISSVLNVVLDIFFVVSLGLGIAGVGIATVLAQFISCILCYFYMRKSFDVLTFEKDDYKLDMSLIKEQIRVGMPMAFFQSLLSISFLFVQSALNTLGNNEVAAYTAAYKMDTLMLQILSAFGTSISTFTAQNYGSNDFDRVKQGAKSCLKITITISIITALIVYFFGETFMILFVGKDESEVIRLGIQYVRFTSCFYIILGVNFVIRFVLTGVGQAIVPLGVGILEVFIRALAAYYLIYPLGFTGMTYTNPLCWGVSTLLIALTYPTLLNKSFNKKYQRLVENYS